MTIVENTQSELGCDELTARFGDLILFYGDGLDEQKVVLLPEDAEIIKAYREDARSRQDWKTSDYLRSVLTRAGISVKDKK